MGLWESDVGPLEERVQRGHQGFMSEPEEKTMSLWYGGFGLEL